MQYIKGPDFPTGAVILGNSGIKKAYDTGKGTITIRSRASIEEVDGHNEIIVTEVPYGVNTLDLKTKLAELVHNKTIEGIADYHIDLKDGVKIIITLKREANPQVVLNNLYKHTDFQVTYGITLLMLDGLTPRTLGLKDIISKYIDFQKEVIIRRTRFDLNKAEERVHILEGLKIALDNIDEVIKIIRGSKTDVIAKEKLHNQFSLDDIQSNAILEMKLRKLTGMEIDKVLEELNELLEIIGKYKEILGSEQMVLDIIKKEMLEIKEKYADERRTHIDMTAIDYIEDESLIPVEDIIVTLTNKGYIKRVTSDTYKSQNRGGVGIKGMTTNEEDFAEHMINMTTHDYLMFFSNKGRVYRMKGYEVPLYSRQSKGLPIINLLPLAKDEKIKAMTMVSADEKNEYLVFCTQNGIVKRTPLEEFENIRTSGKIAISLCEDDELISVNKTNGSNEVMLATSDGRMIRFVENEIRVMGRTASGVKGINVDNSKCIGMEIFDADQLVLIITENGYGKKTNVSEYRMTHRGSKGVKALNITEKNGNIVAFKAIKDDCDLMIITNSGIIIRLPLNQISKTGRVAQGVKLINLREDQKVGSAEIVASEAIEEE